MKIAPPLVLSLACLALPACNLQHDEEEHHEAQKIVVTSPIKKDVVTTKQYVCQIHSQRHINIKALESGYLEAIKVKEGQTVKTGEVLFKVVPTMYQAKLDTEAAEVYYAQMEYENEKKLQQNAVISQRGLLLVQAKLQKAEAKRALAQAELNFATVKAPFDGIIDRLSEQQGSLIKEGDMLTTLSDNSVMWVYYYVPECDYLEYKARDPRDRDNQKIELVLASGNTFPHPGKIATIEAQFNNETGNIPFRADFPNPDGLLRHGQTGTIMIRRTLKDAVVIPQRATYEILDKRYVYVVDEKDVVHQRPIVVDFEQEDVYVIKSGLGPKDKIVLAGIRLVHDGDKVECEFEKPEDALAHQKYHAE